MGKIVFKEQKRPYYQWEWLRILLLAVLCLGAVGIVSNANLRYPLPLLFAVVAFSIAFAIHYFAVSIAINSVYIKEPDQKKRMELRNNIEYPIVGSGMCVLAGGLLILLAGGIGICWNDFRWVSLSFYCIGAGLLFFGVYRYTKWQRGWPKDVQRIIGNQL